MLTLAIVFGGESCEHDVSVITALSVASVAQKKYQTYLVYYKKGTFWTGESLSDISFYKKVNFGKLKECRFEGEYLIEKARLREKKKAVDCVVVACHGGNGENGALSGYFETVRIPYTCCDVFGSSLCMDKVFSKAFFEKWRLSTTKYRIARVDSMDIASIEELGYPVIVKPARQGSSVGITVAKNQEELKKSLKDAFLYDEKVLIEKCLTDYREFNCAVCRKDGEIVASEVEEPIFKKDFLDFCDKYVDTNEARRELPANIEEKLREKIWNVAIKIYEQAELKGIVRVDFLYAGNRLYVNEVNTIPGGLALYLFIPLGYKAIKVLDWIVADALEAYSKKTKRISDYSSTVLENYSPVSKMGCKKGEFSAK